MALTSLGNITYITKISLPSTKGNIFIMFILSVIIFTSIVPIIVRGTTRTTVHGQFDRCHKLHMYKKFSLNACRNFRYHEASVTSLFEANLNPTQSQLLRSWLPMYQTIKYKSSMCAFWTTILFLLLSFIWSITSYFSFWIL